VSSDQNTVPFSWANDRWAEGVVLVCALAVLAIGIYPAPVVAWAQGLLNALGLM